MISLAKQQHRVCRFMLEYWIDNGHYPTLSVIADELGLSKVTIHEHVRAAVKKGAIEQPEPQKTGGYQLTKEFIELESRRCRAAAILTESGDPS